MTKADEYISHAFAFSSTSINGWYHAHISSNVLNSEGNLLSSTKASSGVKGRKWQKYASSVLRGNKAKELSKNDVR